MNKLLIQLANLIKVGNFQSIAGEALFNCAVNQLGKDLSLTAPNEFGCMESVSRILIMVGLPINVITSTNWFYWWIKNSKYFVLVKNPRRGDIVLSPTGFNPAGNAMRNGHVGIFYDENTIMSNDSNSGKFLKNYKYQDWINRYQKVGQYPVLIYRKVI